jgi:hypothetical protein
LRVIGPHGFISEQQGSGLSFGLFDEAGELLADGLYQWELSVAAPVSASVRAKAESLRAQGYEVDAARLMTARGEVVSGYFTVSGGYFVVPGEVEGGAAKDQVFLDDLIVDGSACIGMDCVNGESFGFDTLRLKENNLRIHFDDTSSSASFPGNDWRITINDSSNGGGNFFAVEDATAGRTPFKIEAGAIVNALYVDAEGDVGIGTSTPVVEAHLVDGNTPTLRLEQNGSSGFTPQTWDLAGNETNFFVRDVTNGSKLPFRIEPGADDNAIYIDSTNNIGFGTNSPDSTLDIQANGPELRFTNTGTAANQWEFSVNGNNGRLNIVDVTASSNIPFKIEDGSNDNLFRVGIDGTGTSAPNTVSVGDIGTLAVLDVRGSINVDGTEVHADYVFEEDYALKSIEDHAAFMWQNKHLPGLPKAPEGLRGKVNLVGHQMGILEELETAHIYIEQLHSTLAELAARVQQLEEDSAE